jgi:hypothetical protein
MLAMNKIYKKVSKKQTIEFGLVTILVTLFLALTGNGDHYESHYVLAAFILTLLTMIVPGAFYPFAIFWFGGSVILSAISSRVMLALVFFGVVLPVGLFRKLAGRDPLQIKQFKKSKESVLVNREHLYSRADLVNTF